ncbi:MAG: RNA-directed DNA polymerase [Burkholderiales bacterium]|nr:RNA-directed DNA polymerase [Burkholderiales bacterium]
MRTSKRRTHKARESRLYAIGTRAQLIEILGLPSLEALDELVDGGDKHFKVYTEDDGREIEYPLGEMADCHTQLAKLLKRIELPSYVHSQYGRSYVTNAKAHATSVPLAKTDITKYFPSTPFRHVQRFFLQDMKCPRDVAWYLTKLCTYSSHIPTGSKISNPLAFLANRPLFDSIHAYALKHGCVMTLLQDDIVVSGSAASKKMLNEIQMMIRRWGLKASPKRKKTKTYPASAVKVVTGVVIKNGKTTLPNRRRKLLADAAADVIKAQSRREVADAVLSLGGRIHEADQIDPSAVDLRFRQLHKKFLSVGKAVTAERVEARRRRKASKRAAT